MSFSNRILINNGWQFFRYPHIGVNESNSKIISVITNGDSIREMVQDC